MPRLALAGDTMLGRMVAERLDRDPPAALFSAEVVELTRSADLFLLNLECCISRRGERWPAPGKPFFFRAPPEAVEALTLLGVDCVTLANNHALDYGTVALLDTVAILGAAGIRLVGAGADVHEARAPAVLETSGWRVAVLGVADHPGDFAATSARPGTAFADLASGVPDWLTEAVATAHEDADDVLVTPHWGPNMQRRPIPHVRAAAKALLEAGATLIAGHSAHVFQGVANRVLFDLGDFLDDYRVDPDLRNDLGLLWFVDFDERGPTRIEAVPLALDYCHTRLADPDEAAWVVEHLTAACRELGARVRPDPRSAVSAVHVDVAAGEALDLG